MIIVKSTRGSYPVSTQPAGVDANGDLLTLNTYADGTTETIDVNGNVVLPAQDVSPLAVLGVIATLGSVFAFLS